MGRMREFIAAAERRTLGTLTSFATREPVAALTFDDGPHPEFTPRLLEILGKYGARGTFFMVGQSAARHPEIVRQVERAGHAIGNHSWDHPSFPLSSSRERRSQIRKCEQVLPACAHRIFRPPYGHQNRASRLDAWRLGYDVVTWSIVAEDWLAHEAEWMAERILTTIQPGSIILLHDAIIGSIQNTPQPDRSAMLRTVDIVLDSLRGKFKFLTVPELLRGTAPCRDIWYRQVPEEYKGRLMKRGVQCHTA